MYTDQAKKGGDYSHFKKCICINILNFILFNDYYGFYSCFHIVEDTRHTIYTDKLEFHIIELPKLPEELKENSSDLLLWAKFFNSEREEDFEMLAKKNKYIASAYKQLQIVSQDKQKRLEYEARQKAILDHNQMMLEAKQSGIEEEKYNAAKNFIALGVPFDTISKGTGLSIEEIENLRKDIQ